MKTIQKEALIVALMHAVGDELDAVDIIKDHNYANFKPMLDSETGTYTIHIAPELKMNIGAVEGFKYNLADVSFEISYIGCTYDKDNKCYQWDGNHCQIRYGELENNILFGSGNAVDPRCDSNTWECEGIADIDSDEDVYIAKSAIQAAFDSLSAATIDEITMGVFEKTKHSTDAPDEVTM